MKQNSKSQKLPFAIRSVIVIDVAAVNSGLHLDCTCPSCGSPLVAKLGLRVRHHFAHRKDTRCEYANETLLHMAAKQILKASGEIRLPQVMLGFNSMKAPWILAPPQIVQLSEVVLERRVGSDVPDLIVTAHNRKMAIEITVIHRTSYEIVCRLGDAGYSVLEIDLSRQDRFLVLSELKKLVVDDIDCKKWRLNRLEKHVRADVCSLSERKPLIWRGFALHVDNCPIGARLWRGRPYANVTDDCYQCSHCVDVGDSEEANRSPLLCLARTGMDTYADWKCLNHRSDCHASSGAR